MFRGIFKKVFLVVLVGIIAVNLILFFRKLLFTGGCDLETLLKDRGVTLSSDISDGLGNSISCAAGVPCQYPDSVDLRIIVLTFDRWTSLTKLLNSLNDLHTDGDRVALEIWIDRGKDGQTVNKETEATAKSFHWKNGEVRVHIQPEHVGILGQWIDTWKPVGNGSKEIALILEDDISISPYSYRWLKAARKFSGSRTDVAGITLQSEGLIVASSGAPFTPSSSDGIAYLYSLVGSWGYAPNPDHWLQFQDWYHCVVKDSKFHPYVDGLIMNTWFKQFEREKRSHTMWTMWFIYYCNINRLYTIYNNLNACYNTTKNCLAVNRREPGLHFSGKPVDNTKSLLREWKKEFVIFREPVVMYGFNGKAIFVNTESDVFVHSSSSGRNDSKLS